ncbi:MAG: hypothetical protein HRT51_06750 [Colwellia sp.]|nr:hypothetical protein [Colwellia sp.]
MRKTYLTDSTILSVYDFHNDEKIFLGKLLYGVSIEDQTFRFDEGQRIITSKIKSQNNLEFITKSNSCYVIDAEPNHFELRLSEFVVMRHLLLSPQEVIEAREKLEREDTEKLH